MVQSVSRLVKETLSNLTYLSFAFEHQLVNESALARFIHKRVEEKAGSPVSRGAVIAAVRRFIISFKPKQKDVRFIRLLKSFKIQIRTGLTELNLVRSKKTSDWVFELSKKIVWEKEQKFYALNRTDETTIVTNYPYLKESISRLPKKDILSHFEDRAVITVSYDPVIEDNTFGALHYLTDIFTSLGVTIHVVFSTYSANSFVIKEKDVPLVYRTLSESMREIDRLHED